MILVVLAILMVIAVAAALMSRLKDASGDVSTATTRLVAAQNALEAYAAATQRLPCPADPTLNTGVEAPVNGISCSVTEGGTLPWKTLGMKPDDAVDPWGRKIGYQVFDGASGFTQPGGVSMVACDSNEPLPHTKGTVGGGLCNPDADLTKRNTSPEEFLKNKGLKLTDMGTDYKDVAYVIISYGETGYGGYTISGASMPTPGGSEEKKNAKSGDFTIMAHSDYDTEANNSKHFDDLLVYRRIEDLVNRIGLGPRDWPEVPPPEGTTSLLFTQSNVSGAVGSAVSPGSSTGQSTVNFSGQGSASGLSGSAPASVSLDTSAGLDGLGVAGGATNELDSANNESLQIRFNLAGRSLGLTLTDMGSYSSGGDTYFEVAKVVFYLDDLPVGIPVFAGCSPPDGSRAHFSINTAPTGGQLFNRVDIIPVPALNNSTLVLSGTSSFLVSEVKACVTTSGCKTSLDDGSTAATCATRTSIP